GINASGTNNSFSVTFGHGSTPGLVITSGSLTSLDMTVNSTWTVGLVNFSLANVEFQYTAATSVFSLAGTASVTVAGINTSGSNNSFSVTFGHGSTPGLVITNGSLTSLDMTVNTTWTVGLVHFSLNNVEFVYTAATASTPSI